jgi:hypothetical protein
LSWWTDRLLPICQEFVNTAAGKPDRDFWQCIYKPQAVYAADYITGWLADLFPYLRHGITKAPIVRNHLLDLDRCELPDLNCDADFLAFDSSPSNGIPMTDLPLGICQVGIKLIYERSGLSTALDLELLAGFIGVHQDPNCGTLHPEIGWGVRSSTDRFSQLLDRIQQEHATEPPSLQGRGYPNDWLNCRPPDLIPRELVQMLERFDGARIYGDSQHSWHILPTRLWENYWNDDYPGNHLCGCSIAPFIDLNDGRSIAYNFNFRTNKCWFLLGSKADEFANCVIIATNPTELFEQILATDGAYYFVGVG